MKNSPKSTFILFGLIGFALLIVSFYLVHSKWQFVANSVQTTGKVVDISRSRSSRGESSYHPVVEFTLDNRKITFTSQAGGRLLDYPVNQTVDVIYSKNNPYRAEINSFMSLWLGELLFLFLGSVFFAVGVSPVISHLRLQKLKKELLHSSRKIETDFVEVISTYKIGNRRARKVVTQYSEAGKLYTFYSEAIFFDPTEFIKDKKIEVMVDPGNFKKYYMDLSFLPEMQ